MKMNLKTFLSSLVKTSILITIFLSSFNVNAQKKEKDLDPEEIIARKSAFRSTLLPGWGQATNGGLKFHWFMAD